MLRYLPGILLLQVATVGICWLVPQPLEGGAWLAVMLPIVVLGIFVAFWFAAIARNKTQEALSKATLEFAKERENIQVKAERAKTRLVEKTQKQIANEARRTHSKANFKVGATFAAAVGAGILMLVIEMLTFGLMTLTTAGGALGGYLVRAKKAHRELADQAASPQLSKAKSMEPSEKASKRLIPSHGIRLPKPNILKKSSPAQEK